jgi:PAS domain S-box-containing protein
MNSSMKRTPARPRRVYRDAPDTQMDGNDVSAARYRRLFETSHEGILILDEHTQLIVDANPYMTELLELSSEEFRGKQLWEIGFLRATDSSGVSHVVSGLGVVRSEELRVRNMSHPEGVDLEIVSSSYHEGDVAMIQVHVRDITERKRAELSVAQLAADRVVADRKKNEFLAILSHELRNALAPVANALMILRHAQETDGPVPSRARLLIERQVGHLSLLVDDLQEISSIGSGRMRLQPGLVDLRLVVQRSVEAVMSAHASRQHQLSVELPEEPVWLDADAIRLEQVVVNLLSNAANYTDDGGTIAVCLALTKDHAELTVADSGMGIEAEMLPMVFDLFSRADSARRQRVGGLGIGLNIVKHIVDLHGGSVVAHSGGSGAGSEFIVSLPLVSPTMANSSLGAIGNRSDLDYGSSYRLPTGIGTGDFAVRGA